MATPPKIDPLLSEIDAFLLDCEARNLAKLTLRTYRLALQRFAVFADGKELTTITPDDIRRFLLHLKTKGHNPGGQSLYFRTLKTFFRWLLAEEVIQTDVFRRLKPPKVSSEPLPPAALEDVGALLKVCRGRNRQRDRAILLTLLDTGLRAAELCALDIAYVNLSTGEVLIKRGKGNKRRTVFTSAKTRRELLRYLRGRGGAGALFVGETGDRLKYSGLRQIVRRLSLAAGLPEVPLHSFRRAFAINALRAGMNLITLQRLMGHSSLATTAKYLAFVTDDLHKAHEAAAPVNRLR